MGFNVFARWRQAHQHAAVRPGQRVRLVRMDGCMAHVRGQIRSGVVIAVEAKRVYGDTQLRPWATIQLDEGGFRERCAERDWKCAADGVMEHID